jgi:plastocyanin
VHRTRQAAFAAAICSLALPAAASAATKTVSAGPPSKPKGAPPDADFNAFYPRKVKIHAGDVVSFQLNGFHTVNFPKKGRPGPRLEVPNAAAPTAGVKDAAGNDFWFNGQPSFLVNPEVFFPTKSGGTFDGKAPVHSGAPLGEGKPKPWAVKFPKTGSFSFFCPIHPGMQGTVTVVPNGAKGVPTPKADKARAASEFKKSLATVRTLDKEAAPAGNTITAGPDAKTGEVLFRFTPAKKSVKVGDPVTLTMAPGTTETHTFTFARDLKSLEPVASAFIGPLPGGDPSAPPTLGFNSQVIYPSDQQLTGYDGTQHGDGFFNTGSLDASAKTPVPQKATITFAAPGTYQYLCMIHPDMHGEITVTS